MKRSPRASVDPADVTVAFTSSASSPRGGQRRRLSRALDLRAMAVTVHHRPTGVAVRGVIPEGHYSKREMRKLKEEMIEVLMRELEKVVARHLRAPGR